MASFLTCLNECQPRTAGSFYSLVFDIVELADVDDCLLLDSDGYQLVSV